MVFALLISWYILGFSQSYDTLHVENISQDEIFLKCENDNNFLGFIIYSEPNCESTWFYIYCDEFTIDEQNIDSVIINKEMLSTIIGTTFHYYGCETNVTCYFWLLPSNALENPFESSIIWKRQNASIILSARPGCDYLWSTNETTRDINVTIPGVYSVTQTNDCGSATYSVEVRDNVELYRATVDLRTNKNKVTWLATPEQAEYITEVKVYRDGNLVGTVPYANGYFLDAIGSDAAARTYQIVGVSVEGEDCPIASYQKGTIHTTYYLDVNNDLNMTWNAPYIQEEAEGQLTGYQIYKYNPATEELTLIDEVNATITNYTCSANAFVGGRAILAATFDRVSPPSGGDGQRPEGADGLETRSFSNLSENMFAVGEETMANFKVYPNPAKGAFTVEGAKEVTVYNTLGQVVATNRSEEETHSFSLPSGIYFIKADEMVKKVVVE